MRRRRVWRLVVRVESVRRDRWHVRRGHRRRRRRPRAPVALAAARAGHSSRAKVPLERLAVWLCGAHRTPPAPPHTCVARRWCPRSRLTHMRLPLLSRARSGRRLRARRPCGGRRARRGSPTAPAGAKRRWWNRASCATRSRAATSGTALSKYGGLEGGTWPLSEPTQPLVASVRALERGPGKCTSSGPPCGAQSRGV